MDSRNHFLATSKDETSGLKELPRSTTNLSSHKPRQFSGCTWNRKFVYSFLSTTKSRLESPWFHWNYGCLELLSCQIKQWLNGHYLPCREGKYQKIIWKGVNQWIPNADGVVWISERSQASTGIGIAIPKMNLFSSDHSSFLPTLHHSMTIDPWNWFSLI